MAASREEQQWGISQERIHVHAGKGVEQTGLMFIGFVQERKERINP